MYIHVEEQNASVPLSYLFKVHRETKNNLVTNNTRSCIGLSKTEREKSIIYWDRETNSRKNDCDSLNSYKIVNTYDCALEDIPDSVKDKCIIVE
jgi:hypothetical protein